MTVYASASISLRDAIAEYLHATRGLSPHTRRNSKQRLSYFADWCEQQGLTLEGLKASHIRDYLDDVGKRPGMKTQVVRSSTVRTYGKTLKAFLSWCSNEDDFNVSPRVAARVELPRSDEGIIEIFSPEQISDLFEAVEKQPFAIRDKAILAVLLDTGARASELVGLTLDCVWLDADDSYIKVTGKGRKEREIALGRVARLALRRYITRYRKPASSAEKHVFLGHTGKPLTRTGLHQIIAPIGQKAHIQGVRVSPHTFRHTFACLYLLNGGDVYKLSRLMGHTSIRVTERYLGAIKSKQARQGESVLDRLKSL